AVPVISLDVSPRKSHPCHHERFAMAEVIEAPADGVKKKWQQSLKLFDTVAFTSRGDITTEKERTQVQNRCILTRLEQRPLLTNPGYSTP
ncbi:hypothetical protein INR49_027936, partial [Caranx melampygus]